MIRLLFDNTKATGTPRVFRDDAELQYVTSVTIQPFRRCRVALVDPQTGATTTIDGEGYEVALESGS